MKEIMQHDEIRSAFSEIYNSFYLKHRIKHNSERNDEAWEKIIEDANFLRNKYNSKLASDIIIAIVSEFERESMK